MRGSKSPCTTPSRRFGLFLLAAFAGACGSGGGGGGPAVSFTFASGSGTLAEDEPALLVEVVLHTPAALAEEASVVVADAGTGSATSGSDYASWAAETLTFPAGAVEGASQTISLLPIDDSMVEAGDETAVLRLQDPLGGAVGAAATFTATITDIHVAEIGFATAASAPQDEAVAARVVALELGLAPGVTLGAEASVRVSDSLAGSASSGSDYAPFSARTVGFPSGSADGALATVTVQVIDDAVSELEESVELFLSMPAASVIIGATAQHHLAIADNEPAGEALFLASAGATGTENALAYDELLHLGSQGLGDGPNAGTLVRVTNGGGLPLELAAPDLVGPDPVDFAVEIDTTSMALSAEAGGAIAPDAASPLVARLDGALVLDATRLAELAPLARATLHGLFLPDLGPVTLEVARRPLPIAADSVLSVDGVVVEGGVAVLAGDLQLWSGTVLELPGSRAFLALSSAGVRGFLDLGLEQGRFVHLVDEPGAVPACRIVRSAGFALAAATPEALCAETRFPPGTSLAGALDLPAPGGPGTSALSIAACRLALETDYQLFQRFGSSSELTSYVTSMIAVIGDRYLTDVQTTFVIAYLGIHTNSNDGWEAQESGGGTTGLLDEFRAAWAGNWPAQADLAHFLSGAGLGGGVAYVNVLCNQSFGFGVSANLSGAIDWSSWTGEPANFAWDFVVVAHEIGHNFGALHTHSYCPPLDRCHTNCSGPDICTRGTLMSYCHLCGGMDNLDLVFHPVSADIMRANVNSSCLGDSALLPGDFVQYRVRFDPRTATGPRSAALELAHDAGNEPQPFRVQLGGNATP